MKRLHVHVAVPDLARSIRFYSALFAAEPSVVKPDYAKWMLEDPRVNFAISERGAEAGIRHLGIQAEDGDELAEVYGRLQAADGPVLDEGATVCCYHRSEKAWITDPSGVAWETFLTHGEATVYGGGVTLPAPDAGRESGCCEPAAVREAACCAPAEPAPKPAAAAAPAACCGAKADAR